MAGSSTADDRAAQTGGATVTDPTLNEMLRDAGFEVSQAGRERWRRRLATPIRAEALEEGRRMRDRARGHAA